MILPGSARLKLRQTSWAKSRHNLPTDCHFGWGPKCCLRLYTASQTVAHLAEVGKSSLPTKFSIDFRLYGGKVGLRKYVTILGFMKLLNICLEIWLTEKLPDKQAVIWYWWVRLDSNFTISGNWYGRGRVDILFNMIIILILVLFSLVQSTSILFNIIIFLFLVACIFIGILVGLYY